jgi:apolipoprotein N-acyltransferase
VLALAPFHAAPVLLLTLPVLVWLIDASTDETTDGSARAAWRATLVGWWFGFGYFFAGLFWIGEAFLVEAEIFAWLLPFAVTLLPAGLALFYAAACGVARLIWQPGVGRLLVLAVALAAAEWLRGFLLTGFPWNTLGYALAYPLPLLQTASLFGVYGLTVWVVPVFATPLVALADVAGCEPSQHRRALAAIAAMTLMPVVGALSYGTLRLIRQPASAVEGVSLRIVQPSIPQREKWQRDKQGRNFQLHLDLSRTSAQGRVDDLAGVTHVIWPEAAMPFLPLDTPEATDAIARLLPSGAYLLTGALRLEAQSAGEPAATRPERRRAYNSFMVFGYGGGLAALYDKIHLVPFGEYLPFQQTLEAMGLQQLTRLRGGFTAGAVPRPLLQVAGLPPVAALVCYEAIFPREVIQASGRPGVFINVTNDGWFGTMTGPYQHLHQARVRAVEQGIPLVRAANNGVSAVIDAEGRILASLDLDARGVLDSPLPKARAATLYARLGDWTLLATGLLCIAIALILRRLRA